LDERLKITNFFENDDLWAKFWVEYEDQVLNPLRDNNTNGACVLKFHRLQRLYFDENQKGWRYYMRPNLEKSGWKLEDWAAWFVIRVYIANRDSEHGIFASVDLGSRGMSSEEATVCLKQIWLVFLKARNDWRSAHPYKPVRSSQNLPGIFKKKRARKPKTKPEKIPNGANQARGQITLVWERGGEGQPVAIRIDAIADKTYFIVLKEINDKLHSDPTKMLNTSFEVSEPLSQVIQHYKATKTHGAQIDLQQLAAAATRMQDNGDTWFKFQKRAVDSDDPILVRMKIPGPVDNAITRAIIQAATSNNDGVSTSQHGRVIPADESEEEDSNAASQSSARSSKKRSRPNNSDNSGVETPLKRARYQATVESCDEESEGGAQKGFENLLESDDGADIDSHEGTKDVADDEEAVKVLENDEEIDEDDENQEKEESHDEEDKNVEGELATEDLEDEKDDMGDDEHANDEDDDIEADNKNESNDDNDSNDEEDDGNEDEDEDEDGEEDAENENDEEPEGLSEDDEEKPYVGNLELAEAE